MTYLFYCENCDKELSLVFSMKDDDGRNNAKCPECGKKLKRIFSAPNISIKRDRVVGVKGKSSFVCDGQEVSMGFADHGKMSGVSNRSVGKRMKGVRVDEKTGRLVVDVVSNVKDPLGMLEKSKAKKSKIKIGQKYNKR